MPGYGRPGDKGMCYEQKSAEAGIVWLYLGDALLFLDRIKEAQEAHKKAAGFDDQLWFPRVQSAPAREGTAYVVLLGDFNGKTLIPGAGLASLNEPTSLERTLSLLSFGSGLQVQAGVMVTSYTEMYRKDLEAEVDKMKAELASDSTRFGLWRECAITLELLDRHEEAIEAYAKALTFDPRDRVCQRGLARTTLFKRNGIKYSRFPQRQQVLNEIQQMKEKDPQITEKPRQKPADVLRNIEIVQLTGNSGYVHKQHGKKNPQGEFNIGLG